VWSAIPYVEGLKSNFETKWKFKQVADFFSKKSGG